MKKLLAILLAFSLLASFGTVMGMASYHNVTCCTPGQHCQTGLCNCDEGYCGVYCDCDPWPDPSPDPSPDRDPPANTVSWWRAIFDAITDPLGTVRDVAYTVTTIVEDVIPVVLDVFAWIGNAFAWIAGLFS